MPKIHVFKIIIIGIKKSFLKNGLYRNEHSLVFSRRGWWTATEPRCWSLLAPHQTAQRTTRPASHRHFETKAVSGGYWDSNTSQEWVAGALRTEIPAVLTLGITA